MVGVGVNRLGVLLGFAVGLMNNYVGREAAAPGGLMLLWSCI